MTDATLKTLILDVLPTLGSSATHNQIRGALSVHHDVEIQARRASRLVEEMVGTGTLAARYTALDYGMQQGHYSVVR